MAISLDPPAFGSLPTVRGCRPRLDGAEGDGAMPSLLHLDRMFSSSRHTPSVALEQAPGRPLAEQHGHTAWACGSRVRSPCFGTDSALSRDTGDRCLGSESS